jgi:hypothetical protein
MLSAPDYARGEEMPRPITLTFGADEALRLMVALDTALTVLQVPELTKGMSEAEIQQAVIRFRAMWSELLRKRADVLSAIIRGK